MRLKRARSELTSSPPPSTARTSVRPSPSARRRLLERPQPVVRGLKIDERRARGADRRAGSEREPRQRRPELSRRRRTPAAGSIGTTTNPIGAQPRRCRSRARSAHSPSPAAARPLRPRPGLGRSAGPRGPVARRLCPRTRPGPSRGRRRRPDRRRRACPEPGRAAPPPAVEPSPPRPPSGRRAPVRRRARVRRPFSDSPRRRRIWTARRIPAAAHWAGSMPRGRRPARRGTAGRCDRTCRARRSRARGRDLSASVRRQIRRHRSTPAAAGAVAARPDDAIGQPEEDQALRHEQDRQQRDEAEGDAPVEAAVPDRHQASANL